MASVKEDNPLTKRDFSRVILTLENVLIPDEKLLNSPSVADGLEVEDEMDLRILGCELIQTSGILLKLPQVAMATGQVLFQRFYYSKSFVKHNMEIVAMACNNLASKIEEAPRRIRDVINVFHHIKQVKNGKTISPLILDQNYINLKNQVIKAERRILKELGFCVHVKHPHKIIVMYLQVLDSHKNAKLVQCAWNYMNDSLRTDVFVRYHPETIACACIFLAARQLQVPLPNNPPWYKIFDVQEEEITDICFSIMKLYARKKPSPEKLEQVVSEAKKIQIERKLKNKGLSSAGATPTSNSRPDTPIKLGTSPLTLQNVKKLKGDDEKSDSSIDHHNHIPKRKRSRSPRSISRSRSRSRSPPSPRRRSKSRSYSSRSRSNSRSPGDRKKYRHANSPTRKYKKTSQYKDYRDEYYLAKEKSRSRKRRSPSYTANSRSRSRSPNTRMKVHKKHYKYKSGSRSPDIYSRSDKFRSDRITKVKKRNGHHRSSSRDRYRR